VTLVDENNNGTFDDVGVDSVAVGKADLRAYLGEVISVNGELFEFDVHPAGDVVRYRPYIGPTGFVDGAAGFYGKARVVSVVISSDTCSFNLAGLRRGVEVPVGNYRLVKGWIVSGRKEISVWGSHRQFIHVDDGEVSAFHWGGPLRVEFSCARSAKTLQIRQEWITCMGRAGEAYGFPDGKAMAPPKAQVRDPKTGRVLREVTLGTGLSANGRTGSGGG
jgi:hypothetical protein